MGQKEIIVSLLQDNGVMTQGELAEAIYGDKNHMPNIYSALMSLVNSNTITRTGAHPSKYSLSGARILLAADKRSDKPKSYRDVSGDIISIFHHPCLFYHVYAKKPSYAGLFRQAELVEKTFSTS